MRIVQYLKWLRLRDGGVVHSVLNLSEALAARGHEVVVLSADDSGVPESWKVAKGTPIFQPGRRVPSSVLLHLRDRFAELRGSGAEQSERDKVFQFLDRPSMSIVRDVLRQADVAHVHGPWATSNLQVSAAAYRLGTPYVVSPHGMLDKHNMTKNPVLKRLHNLVLSKRMLRRAQVVHCASPAEMEQARHRFDNPRAVVIPLPFDTSRFQHLPGPELARRKFPQLDSNLPALLFLGRLHSIKGIERLLGASARCRDAGHPFFTMLAGPPSSPAYAQSLRDMAASLGITGKTAFLGMVADQEKFSVCQNAEALVLLSRHENFGLVILEAMCCGTPVITTKGSLLWPDLQASGGALIVDDDAQLDNAILSIVTNKERQREMSEKARAWAIKYVDTESVLSRYEAMYNESSRLRRAPVPHDGQAPAPEPLRVLHLTSSINPALGSGPAQALSNIACEQARQHLKVSVVTTDGPAEADRFVAPLRELGAKVHCTGPGRGPLYKGATSKSVVRSTLSDGVDIVHIHGIWQHLPHCAAAEARRAGIPYIVRPAGMLEPHALSDGKLKKQVHLMVTSRRDLREAAAIQATAGLEARNIAALDFGNPILVIPNGVDIKEYSDTPSEQAIAKKWEVLAGKRRVLFMGRIDPIKGTINLAEAWGRLARVFPDWRLVIAGPDWRGHQKEFEEALARHGGLASTVFVGAVYGDEKRNLLASCDLMVQPSYQENFGITIAESLASARPVITTFGTPWRVLQSQKIGWWIPTEAEALFTALKDAMSKSPTDLTEMGRRGRHLIEQQFTWQAITRQMTEAYQWLLKRGPQPPFAYSPGDAIPD